MPIDGLIRIYCLIDPRTQEVRYIGKTDKEIQTRLSQHISKAKNRPTTHRDKWISNLLSINLIPEISVVEYCLPELWKSREVYWIALYRKSADLTNHSDGGEGSNLNRGMKNHKAVFTTDEVRQAVTLYVLGCCYEQITTLDPFKNLSYKTLRSWAQKECRSDETLGIPMKTEYIRETKQIGLH